LILKTGSLVKAFWMLKFLQGIRKSDWDKSNSLSEQSVKE
jgi:hypothetical protein